MKLADFGLARLYDAEDRERPYTNKVSCGRFWNANPKQVPGSVADPFRSVIIFFSSDPQHKFARLESQTIYMYTLIFLINGNNNTIISLSFP